MRKSTFKVLIAIVVVALCAFIAWSIGSGITGFVNPLEWFKSTEQTNNNKHEGSSTSCNVEAVHSHALELNADGVGIAPRIVGDYTIYGPSVCPDCDSTLYLSPGSNYREATCSSEGSDAYYQCDNSEDCGSIWGPFKVRRNPNNHSDLRLTSETPATCVTAGSKTYTCNGCGGTQTDTVRATGVHKYSWVITTYPANGNAGVESYKCATCTSVTDTRNFFALPADPEKEGYHFVGWYKDEALTIPYESDFIYEDTSLYAKFEINAYTVTFDTDGGNEIDSITVEWNTVITPSEPVKTGYNFVGWYMSDGTKYEGQAIKGNTTLTARWQIKTFTVTFYVNDKVYATVTVEYGSVLSKVADDADVYSSNIVSFLNVNSDTPAVYASEMVVMDDMVVIANEPTGFQRFLHSNYLYLAIAGVGAFVLIGVIGGVVAKKKRG